MHEESDNDFQIDRFQLELEAEKQPMLVEHYGKQSAHWSAVQKEEKRKLEAIQAACAEFIRHDPKGYGIVKDTDSIVLKIAQDEPDYVAQHKIWLEAYQMDLYYSHAVSALIQKGAMIKQLVMLWQNNYYSNPIVTRSEFKKSNRQEMLMEKLKNLQKPE